MHCKTDAINQVSLKCFIQFEGLSPGKSTVLIQILRSFTVRLCSSWWCKGIAQQSLILAFLSDTIISGPCVEMIMLISIYSLCTMSNILLDYPPWQIPGCHKPILCYRKSQYFAEGKVQIHHQSYKNTHWQVQAHVCCFFGKNQEKFLIPSVLSY